MHIGVTTARPAQRAGPALVALLVAVFVAGCGSEAAPAAFDLAVTGDVTSDGPIGGTVSLTDTSQPAQVRTAAIGAGGSFEIDVAGLKAPYVIEAASADGTVRLQSSSRAGGRANVNPVTDAVVKAVSEVVDPAESPTQQGERKRRTAARFEVLVEQLEAALKPLFDRYQVPASPCSGQGAGPALRALLAEVRIEVVSQQIVVTNRQTGAVIFSAPVWEIASGTFDPGAQPAGPGTPAGLDGAALYAAKCSSCHGDLATSTRRGRTAAQITAMHASLVSAAEAEAIAGALATAAPPPAATPAPAPGTPAPALDGASLYATKCSSCHGPLATSTRQGRTAAQITAMHGTMVTAAEAEAIAGALATAAPAPEPTTPPIAGPVAPPPTAACGSCHAVPPASGRHALHASRASCATCHGSGYGTASVDAATHMDGVKNVASSTGWNATSRNCANSCHGSESW